MTINTTAAPTLLNKSFATTAGTTHVDLTFSAVMSKGSGSIFVTDGAVQTVINRSTGQPELRVVGATVTREIPLSQVAVNGTHVEFDAGGLAPGGAYNVFMGVGSLVGNGRAFAGISAPGQAAFTTPEAAPAPVLDASIAIEDKTLKAGADLKVTITFSEAVTALAAGAFSAEHAIVKDISRGPNDRTWTVVLSAADSVESLVNLLRLDMSQVASASGLRGSGMLASSPYAVDTIVDAWLHPHIGVSDTGPFDDDGITADRNQYASGSLAGSLAADEHIELTINGRAVDPALVRVENTGNGWSWTYDANDENGEPPTFAEGANTIVARIVKADGHSSATVVQQVVLDTVGPVVATSPHGQTDLAVGADIVITFDEAVYWREQEGEGDVLYLYGENESVTRVYLSAANFSNEGRTLTIKPSEHKLGADAGYTLRLPENLLDVAGNRLQGYEMSFHTVGAPSAVSVSVDGDGSYRAGETLTFRVRFDEAVRTVGNAVPTLGLSNGAQAQFVSVDGNEMRFRYTVAANDDKRSLAIVDTTGLAGKVEDLAGQVLDAAHIVFSGIHDDAGNGLLDIDIDTKAAAPAAPLLASASNSGSLLDNITSDRTPTLSGTAEGDALVEIYKGAILVASNRADAGGQWQATVDLEHALGDGLHQLTVRQTDRAGNASAASSPLALTVDASAPGMLTGVFLASDTGVSNSDRITRESFAVISGTGAEPDAVIMIMNGGALAGTGTSDAGGNWTAYIDAALPEGVHTVSVHQVDKAGNAGAAAAPLSFTIDRTAPASAPPAPLLAAASDTGLSSSDGITSDTTPTFIGSGALANTVVGLVINGSDAGTAMTDALGNWTINAVGDGGQVLVDGSYSVAVKQFDLAGNASAASSAFTLVVDTTAPAAATFSLAAASDSGRSNSDRVTNVATPTFTGSGALANAELALVVGNAQVGRTTADGSGNWSLTLADGQALSDGAHLVRVRQFDTAGNASADSAPLTVTIDTVGPALTGFYNDRALKQFELAFDEQIVFDEGGIFRLMQGTVERRVYNGHDGGNWEITTNAQGDVVLILDIGTNGVFKLHMDDGDAVQDLAGNVAQIVGNPSWDVVNDL